MGGASSKGSAFLADVDFSNAADVKKVKEFFSLNAASNPKATLPPADARKFLGQVAKYKGIPVQLQDAFVQQMMQKLDRNGDARLSFAELDSDVLWNELHQALQSERGEAPGGTEAKQTQALVRDEVIIEQLQGLCAEELKAEGSLQVVILETNKAPRIFKEVPSELSRPCCPRLKWSEENVLDDRNATHLWIVHRAFELLTHATASSPYAATAAKISEFVKWGPKSSTAPHKPYLQNSIFHDALAKGLYDADHRNPWFQTASWQGHFFDPVTSRSFSLPLPGGDTAHTAIWCADMAVARLEALVAGFRAAPHEQRTQRFQYLVEIFYTLGLILHYFTDVTQPMHAHNWPNFVPPATRNNFHEYYEREAQKFINYTDGPRASWTDLNDDNCFKFVVDEGTPQQGIDEWIIQAARRIGWPNYTNALTDQKGRNWALAESTDGDPITTRLTIDQVQLNNMPPPEGYHTWEDMCIPSWRRTITAAQEATAGFLLKFFETWYPNLLDDGEMPTVDVEQFPSQMTLQTYYYYDTEQGKGVAYNIYTGQPEPTGVVLPYSELFLTSLLGRYGVTYCSNPTYPVFDGLGSEIQSCKGRMIGTVGPVLSQHFAQAAGFPAPPQP